MRDDDSESEGRLCVTSRGATTDDDAASWFLGALHRTHHPFAYWVQRRPAVMMLLVCVSYLFLVLVLLVRDSARLAGISTPQAISLFSFSFFFFSKHFHRKCSRVLFPAKARQAEAEVEGCRTNEQDGGEGPRVPGLGRQAEGH